jgi:heme-degrading monooxygenase HmoA
MAPGLKPTNHRPANQTRVRRPADSNQGDTMTIRVLMTRRIPQLTTGMDVTILPKLSQLLIELRNLANQQPGYISGETLRNVDERNEYLVISTWKSLDAWNGWMNNEIRRQVENQVDALLGASTVYKVYSYD